MAKLSPSQKVFLFSIAAGVLLRAIIAALLPMTGDEAYYVFWGKHPALGYYDQPPMIGWWLAVLLQVSDHRLWVRLPAVLLPAFVAWVVAQLASRTQSRTAKDSGHWAGAIFALAPIGILIPAITTDVPLLFWVAVTVLLWHRERWVWAGLAAGAAFLSKYFAVLLLPALAGHLIYTRGFRRAWRPLVLSLVASLWGPLLHLYWNSQNCWANFVFNLFVRNGEERFLWWHVESFVYQQLYLLTPPLILFVARAWVKRGAVREFATLEATWLWGIPTLVFFALSFQFGIGLHFILAFYPYFFALLPRALSPLVLKRAWIGAAVFLALHGVALGGLLHYGKLEWLNHRPFYRGLLQTLHFPSIKAEMERAEAEVSLGGEPIQWLADAYSQAALLGFYGHRSVWVLGGGSDFGRVTDFVADWQGLDGKSALLFYQYDQEPTFLREYFRSVLTREYRHDGLHYWIVKLSGFDFESYRKRVLAPAIQKFYLPEKLKNFPGSCPLLDYQSTRR